MSNEIRINFHSFVDIITNSSTVIYTYVNSEGAVKEFIDAVLQISGAYDASGGVTAEDLYEFKIVLGTGALERILEEILEDEDHEHYEALNTIYEDPQYEDTWGKKWDILLDYVKEHIDVADAPSDYDGFAPETELVLVPKKPGYREDLGALLEKVFTHEATYG